MAGPPTVTPADVAAARTRIAGRVRRTPLLAAEPVKEPAGGARKLSLKLESLQVTGSFKARGATSKLGTLSDDEVARGIVTASGGNHGLGVAYAGWLAGTPATIFLGRNTPPAKAAKLERWGAAVAWEGAGWDEANAAALAAAERDGLTYVHPFADPAVIAGQGTLALEVLEDAADVDLIVVPVGGGGLISGVAVAAKGANPGLRVVGVEPAGAPTLSECLRAGRLAELSRIDTAANTLAPRTTAAVNLALIRAHVDDIVLVSDDEMRAAARWLWFEAGVAAELAGAAALAALHSGRIDAAPSGHACAVVSGAGGDGLG